MSRRITDLIEIYIEEKLSLAEDAGWRVFSFSTDQVKSGVAVNFIVERLRSEGK